MMLVILPIIIISSVIVPNLYLFSKGNQLNTETNYLSNNGFTRLPFATTYIDMNLTKNNLEENKYSLDFGIRADTNNPVIVMLADQSYSDKYFIKMASGLINTSRYIYYSSNNLHAEYSISLLNWTTSDNLKEYNPAAFPFDTYQTKSYLIMFGCNSSDPFVFQSIKLHSQLPSGFVATCDFNKVEKNEIDLLINNASKEIFTEYGSASSVYAIKAQVTFFRDSNSLSWLSIYAIVPLMGIWVIFAIAQLFLKIKDRIQVYSGAFLATFAFLFLIREFSPPPITTLEGLIVCILGVWAIIEIIRGILFVRNKSKNNSKLIWQDTDYMQ